VIDPHFRVRNDRADSRGVVTIRHDSKLHHIGLGRAHARTTIIMLIADLDIRVINRDTGHLIRTLTLNPATDYQPLGRKPGPPKQAQEWNDVPRQV